MTPSIGPGALAALLAELEVHVESAFVERNAVPLADYPGGPRPSSVVRLAGSGHWGLGENVAFLAQDHERFVTHVEHWFAARAGGTRTQVGRSLGADGTPYERAALEAALIDLALRQAGLSLRKLTGVSEAPLRFVKSLAADANPEAMIQRLRSQGIGHELKVDVHPSWAVRELEALAEDSSIAIFDFKGRGDAALARRLAAACAAALFEDPPAGFERPDAWGRWRVSRDAPLLDETAVAAALARGEAVNLKAPRMGGPLAVLRSMEHVWAGKRSDPPTLVYFGGMFETTVGRVQARQLAALYCPSAPNDLALNVANVASARERDESPANIRLDAPGFGASSDGALHRSHTT